jgi:hypothetical protein
MLGCGGGSIMSENTVEGRAARRRRNVQRVVVGAVVAAVLVLILRACHGDQPYVASRGEAVQQDDRTIAAVNAFMEANGGLSQWRDYYDEGEFRPEPFRDLTGYSVCSDRDIGGFTTADVGERQEVNLNSTSKVTPRKVLENADRAWAKYDITRRGDDRGESSWTQVTYDGGRTGPTFYVSYFGDDPDAKVNMLLLAASVCRDFPGGPSSRSPGDGS